MIIIQALGNCGVPGPFCQHLTETLLALNGPGIGPGDIFIEIAPEGNRHPVGHGGKRLGILRIECVGHDALDRMSSPDLDQMAARIGMKTKRGSDSHFWVIIRNSAAAGSWRSDQ